MSYAPAFRLASAAASARSVRRAGSAESATERSRNAAVAASPPRDCARPADRSSSTATASSGPAAASARCQARRSGSACGSVTSAKARWTVRRSSAVADRYTAERTSGCRNVARAPTTSKPSASAAATAALAIPRRVAARQSRSGSPTGSAAAISKRRRVSSERILNRRMKLSSIRPGSALGTQKPEATRQLGSRQSPRQLEQGQWISARLLDDPVAHSFVQLEPNR